MYTASKPNCKGKLLMNFKISETLLNYLTINLISIHSKVINSKSNCKGNLLVNSEISKTLFNVKLSDYQFDGYTQYSNYSQSAKRGFYYGQVPLI